MTTVFSYGGLAAKSLVLAGLLAALVPRPLRAEAPTIDFVHEIVPILRVHCGKCHTGDAKQGGFSMNSREALLAGGDSGTPGFVEGRAAESEIIARITSDDPEARMPSEGPALSAADIALLRRWIDAKAPWTEQYTFKGTGYEPPLAIRKIELPPVQEGRTNPVDRIVDAYWQKHGVERPLPVDDRVFIRRVSLDLVGLPPQPDRVEAFVSDADPAKRAKLVHELLENKLAYAEHWMTFWSDLLRNDYTGTGFITGGRRQVTQWLHRSLVANMPYDQFVRALVSPSEESRGFIDGIVWRGEVNASQTVPIQFAQNVGQTFLGINLKCASCHDSFVDRWTLQQTYDLAAILSPQLLELHRCDKATGVKATPGWPFVELGQVDAAAAPPQRLNQLALLMTKPENGWLSRTLANRLWQRLMGRGLSHPLDSLRNPPWSEDLLDALAGEFIAHNWNVKQLLELICSSEAYGTATPPVEGQPQGANYVFRGPLPRRMTAEQFTDAVWTLTETAPVKPDAEVVRSEPQPNAPPSQPPVAKWIWSNPSATSPPSEKLAFRKKFHLASAPVQALAVITADNESTLFVDGKRAAVNHDWGQPVSQSIAKDLRQGDNELIVVAANGAAGGPAALRAEMRVRLADGTETIIATDDTWQFSNSAPDDNGKYLAGKEPTDWSPAAVIANQATWSAADGPFATQLNQATTGTQPMVRAVLVKSTPLMVALGRPNRDQVVTSRPTDLTTLEAIQLANLQSLADEFAHGGQKILDRHGPHTETVLNWMYAAALARRPSANELATAREILGENPTAQQVADCLWAIVMLPEFQLIR